MDIAFGDNFARLWAEHFDGAELPICFYYTNDTANLPPPQPARGRVCLVGQLAVVRKGEPLVVDAESLGCAGAKRYLGFCQTLMPNFEAQAKGR